MTSLKVISRETLTIGNRNSLSIRFQFSSGWDGLIKTAIFRNGDNNISVLLSNNTCTIPWEVMQSEGSLFVSLRGTYFNGEFVICTEDVCIGTVKPSLAANIAAEHREATPDVIDMLVDDVAKLKKGAVVSGSNGKSAYELAKDNGFDGTLVEWLASLKGEHGLSGSDGKDGRTPVKGVDYFTDADKELFINEVMSNFVDVSEVAR